MSTPDRLPDDAPSIVVTGGSSGIGAELCRAASRQGWHVWIGYSSGETRAARLADELPADGGTAATVHLPLHEPERLRAAVSLMAQRGPSPQALVLCGAPPPDVVSFTKLSPEQFRRQLDSGITGNHTLIAEMWRQCFRPRGGGHVLAVLSAALGPPAAPHMAAYVAAKGGLEALLNAAGAELGRSGLRVSVVRPGYVETPMLDAFAPLLLDRARGETPHGRFIEPGEVATALLRGLGNPPPPGRLGELSLEIRKAS